MIGASAAERESIGQRLDGCAVHTHEQGNQHKQVLTRRGHQPGKRGRRVEVESVWQISWCHHQGSHDGVSLGHASSRSRETARRERQQHDDTDGLT